MKYLFMGAAFLVIVVVIILLMPVITQWAWANSVGSIFGLREISWKEAFALNLLGAMLTKNIPVHKSK